MKDSIKRIAEMLFILAVIWLLSGCSNTLYGAGGLLKGVGTDWQQYAESSEVE